MMKINRNNYEIFFLDYLDGNLKGKEMDEFLHFIKQNPDLEEELSGIKTMKLPEEEIHFCGKQSLYKSDSQKEETEDYTAVAYMEGDLSELESKLYLKHLEFHPEQTQDLEILMKTRFLPDESVVFPEKNKLYRKTITQQLVYWGTRAAAILLVAFSVWAAFRIDNDEDLLHEQAASLVEHAERKIPTPASGQKNIVDIKIPEKQAEEITKFVSDGGVADKMVIPAGKNLLAERENEPINFIPPRSASLTINATKQVALAHNQSQQIEKGSNYYTLDTYLAEKVLKIKKTDKSLIESGLDLAGNVSKKRISYETEDGKISKINFESRLLAFSLPVKNNK